MSVSVFLTFLWLRAGTPLLLLSLTPVFAL